jgi:hypothetical protein
LPDESAFASRSNPKPILALRLNVRFEHAEKVRPYLVAVQPEALHLLVLVASVVKKIGELVKSEGHFARRLGCK